MKIAKKQSFPMYGIYPALTTDEVVCLNALTFFVDSFLWRSSPGKVQVMTKKTGKMTMPKEKEKGPPAYSVDDAMNKGSQLPQMLDFHKQR